MATRIESKRAAESLSPKKKVEARATKMGLVVTKITELATEVYFREDIQRAK
jgi:hypothetical protein